MPSIPMTPADLSAFAKSAEMIARFAEIARLASEAEAQEEAARAARPATAADRMAEDMRLIAGATDACTVEDLVLKGWTRAAIHQHRELANRIALEGAGDARMESVHG